MSEKEMKNLAKTIENYLETGEGWNRDSLKSIQSIIESITGEKISEFVEKFCKQINTISDLDSRPIDMDEELESHGSEVIHINGRTIKIFVDIVVTVMQDGKVLSHEGLDAAKH